MSMHEGSVCPFCHGKVKIKSEASPKACTVYACCTNCGLSGPRLTGDEKTNIAMLENMAIAIFKMIQF